jgi:glycosyltransferase involved in cell wall biosynthesis
LATTKIIVDTGRASTLNSGLGQVVFRFAEALAENPPGDMEFTFLVHSKMEPIFTSAFNFHTVVSSPLRRLAPRLFSTGDIWHILNPDSRSVPLRHPGIILTVHDLRVLSVKHGNRARSYRRRLQELINNSIGITAISEFTRTDTKNSFSLPPVPFDVISNGISAPAISEPGPITDIQSPYLLALGLFEEKKRFHLLIQMMAYLPEFNLYLAGFNDNAYGEECRQLAADSGCSQRIHFAGPVDENLKWQLYANSEALVFPSELEGFGLPVLEAMAMGKPVFISNDGALPETGGRHANHFTSLNPEDMASQVKTSMRIKQQTSASEREQYARSFTWQRAVEHYLDFYRSVL